MLQQFYSILERYQTTIDYPLISNYRILDDHDQFTDEAKEYLLPYLRAGLGHCIKISAEQEDIFRWHIAALPTSEQIFYTTEIGDLNQEKEGRHNLTFVTVADNCILGLKAVEEESNDEATDAIQHMQVLIHLTNGGRDALSLARYGADYVRALPKPGMATLNDMEYGFRNNAHFTYIYFPGLPYAKNVHEFSHPTHLAKQGHDIAHSNLQSETPDAIRRIFIHKVDVIREALKGYDSSQWDKITWDYIDYDYVGILAITDFDNVTSLYCKLLSMGNGTTHPMISMGGGLLQLDKQYLSFSLQHRFDQEKIHALPTSAWHLTALGAIIFLDMLKNPANWASFDFNPADLISPFKEFYKNIKKIYPSIQSSPFEIQIFKCLIYANHKIKDSPISKQKLYFDYIHKNESEIKIDICFKKLTADEAIKKGNIHWKNVRYLSYQGKEFTPEAINEFLEGIKKSQSEITQKIVTFKKIYQALRDGQSSLYKTNFLADKAHLSSAALMSQIEAYGRAHPDSRTQKAWALTNQYFDQGSENNLQTNTALISEIYEWGFAKSGVFKMSRVTGTTFFLSKSLNTEMNKHNGLTSDQIDEGVQNNGRIRNIVRSLNIR